MANTLSARLAQPTRLALARFFERARRGLLFMVAMCTAIALLLTAVKRGGFGTHLVYSFSIGLCCWLVTDGVRVAVMGVIEAARLRRGVSVEAAAPRIGWQGMLPMLILGALVGPMVGTQIADAFTGNQTPRLWMLDSSGARFSLAISVIASITALFVLTILERMASVREQASAAQRAAAENQLKLLQSQLEPHMLFNTLANLRVLIAADPARAQRMLDHLIGFLRATLTASRSGSHTLAAEFERTADYLALMQIRMGARLAVTLDLPADLKALAVPPLLLQPLVENAIRHGLEPKVEGGRIEVRAQRMAGTPQRLELLVRDTGIGLQQAGANTLRNAATPSSSTHFGLAQIRERLRTLHGGAAELSLQDTADGAGGTLARITMPWPATGSPSI